MILQGKNIADFKSASEILFSFDAVARYGSQYPISRLAIQKILYLSRVLSPIKNIAVQIANYIAHYQGPWNPNLQGVLDHLVGTNYIEVVSFEREKKNKALAYYRITEKGRLSVQNLKRLNTEEEKSWWLSSIVRLIITNIDLIENSRFEDLDKVRDIVYADPTFDEHLRKYGKNKGNIFNSSSKTFSLIEYSKELYISRDLLEPNSTSRKISELLLIGFFDFLTEKAIAENDKTRS